MRPLSVKTQFFISLILVILVLVLSFLSEPMISPRQLFFGDTDLNQKIFFTLRLNRFVLAALVGGALSLSGVSFQALLKNPLADPYILGVSGGAALGYVVAVALGVPFWGLPFFGFLASLCSLWILHRLSESRGVLHVYSLLLVGIVFNSFSFAFILVINSLVNFGQAQQILFLLLGHLDPLPWDRLALLSVFVLTGFYFLWRQASELNILSLGDEQAFHLGLDVQKEKRRLFVISSLLVGACVSLCGLIGFVGLIVPHLCRLLFGADHRRVLPASFVVGAALMAFCEYVASSVFSFATLNTKIPVGAVTALIGAPLFIYFLKKHQERGLKS